MSILTNKYLTSLTLANCLSSLFSFAFLLCSQEYTCNGRVQVHFKPLLFLFLLFQTEYYQCLAAHHDRIEHNCACRVIRVLHLDGWLDQVGEGEGGEAGKGSG